MGRLSSPRLDKRLSKPKDEEKPRRPRLDPEEVPGALLGLSRKSCR